MASDVEISAGAAAKELCERLNDALAKRQDQIRQSRSDANMAMLKQQMENPDPFSKQHYALQHTAQSGGAMPEYLPPMPEISFRVNEKRDSYYRTPADQAEQVIQQNSWVCWGAHMSGMARHIIPKIDGKETSEGNDLEKALGKAHLDWFKQLWKFELSLTGLRDAGGNIGFMGIKEVAAEAKRTGEKEKKTDQLHVELVNAKLPKTDPGAEECVDVYARLRHQRKADRNTSFESHLGVHLKARLVEAEKKLAAAAKAKPGA